MADSIDVLTRFNHGEQGNPHPQYSNEGIRASDSETKAENTYLPIFDFKMDGNLSDGTMWRIFYGFKAVDESSDNNHGILNITGMHTINYSGKLINIVGTSWDIYDPATIKSVPFQYLVYYKNLGNNIYEVKSYIYLTGQYKKLTVISPWVYVPTHNQDDQREFLPRNSRIPVEQQTGYFFDPINLRTWINNDTFTKQVDGFTKVENQEGGGSPS